MIVFSVMWHGFQALFPGSAGLKNPDMHCE